MNRQQLAHILRAAYRVVDVPEVLVLGSQSILGTFDEDGLPPEATASMEADIGFLDDPDRSKADLVEGAIGEMSAFHDMDDVYAEGISIETAILPDGWRDRLLTWELRACAAVVSWSRMTWPWPSLRGSPRRIVASSMR